MLHIFSPYSNRLYFLAQSTLKAGSKSNLITFIFKPGLSSDPTFWNAENLGSGLRLKPLILDWIALSETNSFEFWISLDPRFNPAFWIPAYGFRSWDHTSFSFDRRRDNGLRISNETPSRSLRCTGVSHSISRTALSAKLAKTKCEFHCTSKDLFPSHEPLWRLVYPWNWRKIFAIYQTQVMNFEQSMMSTAFISLN